MAKRHKGVIYMPNGNVTIPASLAYELLLMTAFMHENVNFDKPRARSGWYIEAYERLASHVEWGQPRPSYLKMAADYHDGEGFNYRDALRWHEQHPEEKEFPGQKTGRRR